jgi:High-affinity K+ transport system, ATPase chain B
MNKKDSFTTNEVMKVVVIFCTTFLGSIVKAVRTAQSESIKKDIQTKLLNKNGKIRIVNISDIKKGDIVLVEVGDIIPSDGEVVEGLAYVDESAITGESVPVIKEPSEDFNSVICGTRVVSDWLKIKITTTYKKH